MIIRNGQKWACKSCITGHRSSKCTHEDRELFPIAKKGRPSSQCKVCQDGRQGAPVTTTQQPLGVQAGELQSVKCTCQSKRRTKSNSRSPKEPTLSVDGHAASADSIMGQPNKRRRESDDGPGAYDTTSVSYHSGWLSGQPAADGVYYYSSPSSSAPSSPSSTFSSSFTSQHSHLNPGQQLQWQQQQPHHHTTEPPAMTAPTLFSDSHALSEQYSHMQTYPHLQTQTPVYSNATPTWQHGMPPQPPPLDTEGKASPSLELYRAMGVQGYSEFAQYLSHPSPLALDTPRGLGQEQYPHASWPLLYQNPSVSQQSQTNSFAPSAAVLGHPQPRDDYPHPMYPYSALQPQQTYQPQPSFQQYDEPRSSYINHASGVTDPLEWNSTTPSATARESNRQDFTSTTAWQRPGGADGPPRWNTAPPGGSNSSSSEPGKSAFHQADDEAVPPYTRAANSLPLASDMAQFWGRSSQMELQLPEHKKRKQPDSAIPM